MTGTDSAITLWWPVSGADEQNVTSGEPWEDPGYDVTDEDAMRRWHRHQEVVTRAAPIVLFAPTRWDAPRLGAPAWPHQLVGLRCPRQRQAVAAFAQLCDTLDRARPRPYGWRRLAAVAGLSPSVAEAVIRGRRWPDVRTLGLLAAVLGHRLLLVDERKPPITLTPGPRSRRGPARPARPGTHRTRRSGSTRVPRTSCGRAATGCEAAGSPLARPARRGAVVAAGRGEAAGHRSGRQPTAVA